MATKKTGGRKAAAKKPGEKAARPRFFIQLYTSKEFRESVLQWLKERGFDDADIGVSPVGRLLFEAMMQGKSVKITSVADFHKAQAALSENHDV